MIFGQRMHMTDLSLSRWVPVQSGVLRATTFLEELRRVRPARRSTLFVDNPQVISALALGILIGLSAAKLPAEQLMFAIAYAAPIWPLVLLQLLLQQGLTMRRVEQLPAQRAGEQRNQPLEQNQTSQQSIERVMTTVPDVVSDVVHDDESLVSLIEDALRHLHDYSYLGLHPLAQLQLVKQTQICSRTPNLNTHLEAGRTLHTLLVDVIGQLCPAGQLPNGAVVPQRVWHPYIILQSQYVQRELTRQIMARLYIGEGTYNRTRRRAVQGIAQALLELERQIEGK